MKRRADKNQKSKKINGLRLLGILLMIAGIVILLIQPVQNWIISQQTEKYQLSEVSPETLKENQSAEGEFDFSKVEDISFQSVLEHNSRNETLPVIGAVAIPAVKLNLPVFKGVSNENLLAGAGTMKEAQVIGAGNYALASHRMKNPDLLFSPLVNVEAGDLIYVTDLATVSVYKVTTAEMIQETRVDVIEDVPGRTLITMVTCNEDGSMRWMVQGEKTASYSGSDIPEVAKKAFGTDKNNVW